MNERFAFVEKHDSYRRPGIYISGYIPKTLVYSTVDGLSVSRLVSRLHVSIPLYLGMCHFILPRALYIDKKGVGPDYASSRHGTTLLRRGCPFFPLSSKAEYPLSTAQSATTKTPLTRIYKVSYEGPEIDSGFDGVLAMAHRD